MILTVFVSERFSIHIKLCNVYKKTSFILSLESTVTIYLSCKKKNHIVIATSDQRLTMGVLTLCKNYYILLSRKIY